MKQRKPLRRTTPLPRSSVPLKRSRLAPVSAKKRAERPARLAVRAAVLARDRTCRAASLVPETTCWHPHGEPLDVHELIQRSLWPAGYLEPSNCIAVCRAHHDWIDANIDAAHDLGLLRRSWTRDGPPPSP